MTRLNTDRSTSFGIKWDLMINERMDSVDSVWTNPRIWFWTVIFAVLLPIFFLEDGKIHALFKSNRAPIVNVLMHFLTRMGGGWVLALEALVLFGIGWWWKDLKLKQVGVRGLIAMGVSGVLVQVIKHVVGRPRPRLADRGLFEWGPTFERGHDSFPSGHAISAFAMAAVLSWYFPAGRWIWYSIAALIAFSRVYVGAHYASDVMFGAILGVWVGFWANRLKLERLKS
jgi:membrane-associated phospholipid phosphatase